MLGDLGKSVRPKDMEKGVATGDTKCRMRAATRPVAVSRLP
jgi:hypothetical protein